jgi:ketosteroid isomerase-like protein
MAKKSKKTAKRPAAKKKAKAIKPKAKASRKAAVSAAKKNAKALVTSGTGASTEQLGKTLVSLFNQNKADDWIKGIWSKDVESIEGTGQVARGRAQILSKWDWWTSNHEVMGASAEGPYVGATGFAAKFQLHVKDKSTGADMHMTEVAVYTVKNGKITREEFMYSS